ncbi:MAG: 4-hydroxy-tetrahydrodipicolinate reductase [Microscillaceae bacterium]|jgi:4-hydroxy-tetrahydrodipicolinate reductase|nr:4-hydroxy-tetrahydrodipicolinate reductase [Microscillaceae bacterium]
MRIALIGYGKMGKIIEQIALQRGHQISGRINIDNQDDLWLLNRQNTDVAIEFTQPESVIENLKYCINQQIPVVCGTTGWLNHKPEIEQLCVAKPSAFFYASNFSIGVNLFFQLNQHLARLMATYPQYEVKMEEIHHTEKKDAPSGTAITLAEGILAQLPHKKQWVNQATENSTELSIISKREPHVPGTHTVVYQSSIDEIEIKHTAHSREGFALGAVLAAEFVADKVGVFGMEDLLKN